MLKSLQSRLLLSYGIVIMTVLLIVAAAAFVVVSLPVVRYMPTLRQLDTISRVSRGEILRLIQARARTEQLLQTLQQTAVENNVRVLVANIESREVVFDSNNSNWVGTIIDGVVLPSNLLPTTDRNTLAGLYTHENGSTWLLYSRAISNFGSDGGFIMFARPEPTGLRQLRELGLLNFLLGTGGVAFLLAILLAFGIAAWVARPLQKMADATEAIAEGNYDQQLPLQGPEEVQRVAFSFNSMAAQVAATRHAQRDFVANVSHDLKTPITSIQGWSQALLDGAADTPEAQKRAANIIYSEAERMSRMVRQLLDLAKIESGQLELHKEAVDLGLLIQDVHRNLHLRAQSKGIHLTVDVQTAVSIHGDPDRLMQLFTNLVDNALTHTPADGRVHLTMQPHGEKAVEVIVQDTGKGIDTEELSRIFERFYQVEKSRAQRVQRVGSGLGLSIVQELVALHNGRIFARSQVGKGSAFIVRLPIHDKPEASTIVRRV